MAILMTAHKPPSEAERKSRTTLRTVAKHVRLSPGTVSAVLNNTSASRSIPTHTKERIFTAARELNYKPDFWARALRLKRTYTIGVMAEEIGDPYGSLVISGIERQLQASNYFYLTVVHRHKKHLLQSHSQLLFERGVEGYITVDTSIDDPLPLPAVAVAGHHSIEGVTNIVIDHRSGIQSALQHLVELGHRDVAFMKGPASSSDSEERWNSIAEIAERLEIRIRPELVLDLNNEEGTAVRTPEHSYPFVEEFLRRNQRFTALFAYNDNSAIAAIRVFQNAGLHVPEDVSVIGFDDIQAASFTNPPLTTVRQPLELMGETAASTLLDRIEGRAECIPEIAIQPQFVVRRSTCRASAHRDHPANSPNPAHR